MEGRMGDRGGGCSVAELPPRQEQPAHTSRGPGGATRGRRTGPSALACWALADGGGRSGPQEHHSEGHPNLNMREPPTSSKTYGWSMVLASPGTPGRPLEDLLGRFLAALSGSQGTSQLPDGEEADAPNARQPRAAPNAR
eukprot:8128191-Pyramimonas_sp.AAC.1